MSNRLKSETSPYLLHHAKNPVDWYPWGEEALSRAVQEDKPILLSIGYSACHWCHVMERECFENPEIARIMNDNFINVKVDREERPDLDSVYMEAVQAMTGTGGWPLTVFLTHRGRPFYGGTYFPPVERPGMPSFPRVLETVAEAYRTRRGDVEAASEEVTAHLNRAPEAPRLLEPLTTTMFASAYLSLKAAFDPENGGFGSAPKFPQPMILDFLLRYHHRTGDKDALQMVEHTLQRMARGGIYDHVGGGFHRYAVDARWLVPHFEKMLYDNALLGRVYLHAYQVTGKRLYRRIVEDTLDYVLREMRDVGGGFYSSQDADSEGVEGRYYLWTPDEVLQVLGEDEANLVIRFFGITNGGNLDGGNILSQVIQTESLALEFGVPPEDIETRIDVAKERLLARRAQRVRPHRDEKILADWNGLMLATLAEAASVLDREDYLQAALSNAGFFMKGLIDGRFLKHSYKDGQTKSDGYLQDYALVSEGFLVLYQTTFQQRWLEAAIALGNAMVDQFWDQSRGCFYDTGDSHEGLVVRPRTVYDNAVPSGAAAAAFVLIHLARYTGNLSYERTATTAMRSIQGLMSRYPLGFGHWLGALDFYLSQPLEIAVVGRRWEQGTQSLLHVVNQRYLPNKVLAGRDPEESAPKLDVPLLRDRDVVDNQPTAYLCSGHVCHNPASEPSILAALLDGLP